MTEDQFTRHDPTQQYTSDDFGPEQIDHPGRTADMDVTPDHGEHTYRGSGRLAGKRAVITGGDSGIGRAGQPAELAPSFVFLASQESSYTTGEVLGVTGGRLLP